MNIKIKYKYLTPVLSVLLVVLAAGFAKAQSGIFAGQTMFEGKDMALEQNVEKIYVQLDKSYYVQGELIWYNLYSSKTNNESEVVMRIELVSPAGDLVQKQFVTVTNGVGNGVLELKKNIEPGIYRIFIAYDDHYAQNQQELVKKIPVYGLDGPETIRPGGVKSPDKSAVTFYPEGGQLIKDQLNKIIVTTKDHAGKPMVLTGNIYDQNKNFVAKVTAEEKGMGYFEFTPGNGAYFYMEDTSAATPDTVLPKALSAKINMSYSDALSGYHSFHFLIDPAFQDISSNEIQLHLIGTNDGRVSYKHSFVLDIKKSKNQLVIPLKQLPHGITYFGLFDNNGILVSQRALFNEKFRPIQIKAFLDQKYYKKGAPVILNIETLNQFNKPVPAKLSVKVVNEKFNNPDLTDSQNIVDSFYLRNKGNVIGNTTGNTNAKSINKRLIASFLSKSDWENIFAGETRKDEKTGGTVSQIIERIKYLKNNEMPGMARISVFFVEAQVIDEFYIDEIDELKAILRDVQGSNHIFVFAYDWKGDRIGQIEFNGLAGVDNVTFPVLQEKLKDDPVVNEYINFKKKSNIIDLIYGLPGSSHFNNKDQIQNNWEKADYSSKLADFNTLPTMKEVIRGIVPKAHVKKENGRNRIYLSPKISSFKYEDTPLILINNIPTFNDSLVLTLDVKSVEKIEVRNTIRSISYFGTFGSKGVLSILLKKGVENPIKLHFDNLMMIEGTNPMATFNTYRQRSSEDKIPDFRQMLYWNSSVNTDENGKAVVEFDNNDLPSGYAIYIEGVSMRNEPGSVKINYKVIAD